MSRWQKDSADPDRAWGEQPQEEDSRSQRRPRPRQEPRRRWLGPQRPAEVSATVWELTQQWLEEVEGALGQKPFVNKEEFSKRLSVRIRHDPEIVKFLRPRTFNPESGKVEYQDLTEDEQALRHREIEETLAKMIWIFVHHEVGPGSDPRSVQHQFLDGFEDLLDRARTLRHIERWRAAGEPTVPAPAYQGKQDNPHLTVAREARIKASVRRALETTAEAPQSRSGKRLPLPIPKRPVIGSEAEKGTTTDDPPPAVSEAAPPDQGNPVRRDSPGH